MEDSIPASDDEGSIEEVGDLGRVHSIPVDGETEGFQLGQNLEHLADAVVGIIPKPVGREGDGSMPAAGARRRGEPRRPRLHDRHGLLEHLLDEERDERPPFRAKLFSRSHQIRMCRHPAVEHIDADIGSSAPHHHPFGRHILDVNAESGRLPPEHIIGEDVKRAIRPLGKRSMDIAESRDGHETSEAKRRQRADARPDELLGHTPGVFKHSPIENLSDAEDQGR